MEFEKDNDECLCDCGDCRYCNAYNTTDYDYQEDSGYACTRCGGAGCLKCE